MIVYLIEIETFGYLEPAGYTTQREVAVEFCAQKNQQAKEESSGENFSFYKAQEVFL